MEARRDLLPCVRMQHENNELEQMVAAFEAKEIKAIQEQYAEAIIETVFGFVQYIAEVAYGRKK